MLNSLPCVAGLTKVDNAFNCQTSHAVNHKATQPFDNLVYPVQDVLSRFADDFVRCCVGMSCTCRAGKQPFLTLKSKPTWQLTCSLDEHQLGWLAGDLLRLLLQQALVRLQLQLYSGTSASCWRLHQTPQNSTTVTMHMLVLPLLRTATKQLLFYTRHAPSTSQTMLWHA